VNYKDIIEKIDNNLPLKLIIQNIPHIGGSLSTILSSKANEWKEKRLNIFFESLDKKMKSIQIDNDSLTSEIQKKVNSENFYYLFIEAGQKATMSYKSDKIAHFANILKNYLIKDISSEDYIIEMFLDITENLTDNEINKLSELQEKPLEIFYTQGNKVFNMDKLKDDISSQKLSTDFRGIPKEYLYDEFFLYCYNRLEKYELIEIATVEQYGGSTSAGWNNGFQGSSVNFHYGKKDEVSITSFGKKYIDWIIN